MKRIMSLVLILIISLSSITFADSNLKQLELDAVLLKSVDSIDDITKSNKNASFKIKEFDLNEKILIAGYIENEQFSEYIEITGDPYHSYYNKGDVVINAKSNNANWSIEHFVSFKKIPSNKVLFNKSISESRAIQIILKNKSTNEVIIIEDKFKKLSQKSSKLIKSTIEDPFLEHWWTRILLPSNSQTKNPSISRNLDVDFDSYYSSRYNLGSGYWAKYYIKVEQTGRYYDLSSVGSNSTDYLGLTIVDEKTTTNYWGVDDLNDTPLIIKNVRGEYKISASSGNEINDEFINTKWGGYYHDRSGVDFSVSASIAKIIGVSLSYSPISNIQIDDDYLIPTSFGPAGGFKISYPGYLDKEGDQYNLEVVKERSDVKNANYYMQGSFYFDYSMNTLGSPLSSGSTFTIGEYE